MDTKIDQLKQIIPEKYILRQEPMKIIQHSVLGDPLIFLWHQRIWKRSKRSVVFAKEEGIPLFVLGNGSNLLVADDGMDGICSSDLQKLQWN